MVTITLQNGTTIKDLMLNGTNYISGRHIDESIFRGNMGTVTFDDDDGGRKVMRNAELIQQVTYDGGSTWWLCFRELSQRELLDMELRAKIDYIAMMTDVEV